MTNSQQLLAEYASRGSEAAFQELVSRYIDLVFSTALRSVGGDAHRAEDVVQTVFVDLARQAPRLAPDTMLGGWLHRATCCAAANLLRGERRRQLRERQAAEMNALNQSEPVLAQVAPVLDEALNALADEDRKVILLRFYERRDLRSVGEALGSSENAAQKRVSRALEQLQGLLKRRGITSTAAALSGVLSASAIQSAPLGLAATVSKAALAGTTLSASAAVVATKTLAMTTLQKGLVVGTLAVLAGTGIYKAHRASLLGAQVQTLQAQQAPLREQLQALQHQLEAATQQVAGLQADNERLNRNTPELMKLRAEVGTLRRAQVTREDSARVSSPTETAGTSGALAEETGKALGVAVVRGEPGALEKLVSVVQAELASFNTNSAGLNDTQRGELASQTFAPLHAAFQVIQDAATQGNQVAIDAVVRAMQIPELKGSAVQCVGAIAGTGSAEALAVLLHPEQYGIRESSVVPALRPAADKGNQQAIDALAVVTRDANQRGLWFMAAQGLEKSAAAGNSVAIDALIGLSASTNWSVRHAALAGLQGAAANQNPKAAEALRALSPK